MAAHQYELLKCADCGKTLGYIYISAKTSVYESTGLWYWPQLRRSSSKIEKTAFCESCFQKRLNESSKDKLEPKIEEDKSVEPQPERKSRRLVR